MKRKYQLIYKTEFRLVPDYVITEEQYLDYYQNSNDPTFENFEYPLKLESVTSNTVSYVDTALNVLKQGKKLSILTWQDFANFIEEWVFTHRWRSCHKIFYRNGGISFTTTKAVNDIGEIKCIWLTKKYSFNRPVGVKLIRELGYLISATRASKGIIVTTSSLTKGALKLVEENRFTMSYIDNTILEEKLRDFEKRDKVEELPF